MRTHANTLYVTTPGAYVGRSHETLQVKVEGKIRLTVPLHHLESVVCFGRVGVSHAAFALCAERGVAVSLHSPSGRFLARLSGPTQGNVLLRREQYRQADRPEACLAIAKPIIAAKIHNSRGVLLRSARDEAAGEDAAALRAAADHMAALLADLAGAETLDVVRGIEGACARRYFAALSHGVRKRRDVFHLNDGRTRRPPRDPMNALLSFLYALLRHDVAAALEAVGLDPTVGFLHVDRPGRPSLALDLMEEFRPLSADRLALTLVNRGQLDPKGFSVDPAGSLRLSDAARRTVLQGYQERKREEITHPLLGEATPVGLLPHIQARLLARTIRGEHPAYPALVLK